MEAVGLAKYYQNDAPYEELIKKRIFNTGGRFTAVMVERNEGIELPCYVLSSEVYQKFTSLCDLLVSTVNDFFGIGKDIVHEQPYVNSILLHNRRYHTSLNISHEAIMSIHDQGVVDYDVVASELMAIVDDEWRERMVSYLQAIRNMLTGFALWHTLGRRYSKYLVVENGIQFAVDVISKDDSRL